MNTLRTLAILFLFTCLTNAESPPVITPEQAKDFVGKVVTVRGVVDEVSRGKTDVVFLNMGGKFPREKFTIFIRHGHARDRDWSKLEGKTVSITGTIERYKGHAQIAYEKPEQLTESENAEP